MVLNCVLLVSVLFDVIDEQITATEDIRPQRREVVFSGDGNCFYRDVAL